MSGVDTSPVAIAAIMEGVTPGPWVVDPSFQSHSYVRGGNDVLLASCSWRYGSDPVPALANARFIAAARELVPALDADRDALRVRAEQAERREAAMKSANEEARQFLRERNALRAEVELLRGVLTKLEYWMDTDDDILEAMTNWDRADHMGKLSMIRAALKGDANA